MISVIRTFNLIAVAAPVALARMGGVAIFNDCSFPVYSNHVVEGHQGAAETIQPKNWYYTTYQYPKSGGISIKLRKDADLWNSAITQLEYCIAGDGNIYYDISNVDCGPTSESHKGDCPFLEGGMFLHSSQSCPTRKCASGDVRCHEAYNRPKDDWATAGCEFKNQNLVLYVCRTNILGVEKDLK